MRALLLTGLLGVVLALTVAATHGSEADPLVTLGYLKERFLPEVMIQFEAKAAEREKTTEVKIQAMVDGYTKEMEQRFQKALSQGQQTAQSGFAVVDLTAGQTLLLATGSEVLLRSGEAVCVATSAPGLVDTTGGEELESKQPLQQNHLYLSTTESRGLTAGTAVCVLVRGTYTIS